MTNSRFVYLVLLGMMLLAVGLVAYLRTLNPGHSVTLDSAGIVQELGGMNELVTARYVVQRVLTRPGPADSDSRLVMVQGTVLASVDLETVKPADVRLDGNTVDVHLPAPKITGVSIDDSQTKVWEAKISMWTSRPDPDSDLPEGMREQAIAELRQTAEQSGILKEADLTARRAIRHVLMAAGMGRVNFP
jgi:hypothetical protein